MKKILPLLLMTTSLLAQSLPDDLRAYLQRLPATTRITIAVEDLTDSRVSFFHEADERVPAASVIKLPILIEAMEEVRAGRIDPAQMHRLLEKAKTGGSGVLATYPAGTLISYRELMTLMMTHSDNTATNILIREIGLDKINRRIRQSGLRQTALNRVMMDTAAVRQGRENFVTAREMNRLLKKIYRKEIVTPALCDQMLGILKQNIDTLTIARLLPKNVVVAHKTGGLPYIRGDAGIVYAKRPFALSVFVQGAPTEEAERLIGELAERCYRWFKD